MASTIASNPTEPDKFVIPDDPNLASIRKRAVVVKRLKILPIEAIVRRYLAGNAWQAYQRHCAIGSSVLPSSLSQAQQTQNAYFYPNN